MTHCPSSNNLGVFLTGKGHTSSLHHFVDFALNVELRVFGFDTFKLDGNFFSCSNVRTLAKKEKHSISDRATTPHSLLQHQETAPSDSSQKDQMMGALHFLL